VAAGGVIEEPEQSEVNSTTRTLAIGQADLAVIRAGRAMATEPVRGALRWSASAADQGVAGNRHSIVASRTERRER